MYWPEGVLTLLKFPYPRCVDEPETYDQIRVHAEWGTQFKSPKEGAGLSAALRGGLVFYKWEAVARRSLRFC